MAGEALCNGTPNVSGPEAAWSDSDTELPLTSNGTWICEAVSVASSTGAARSWLRADSTRAPNTLNNAPGAGRAPFVHRNNSSYAGVHNLDMRIARTFPIHEKLNFQIFAEAFNLANHQNVTSVGSTAYTVAQDKTTLTNTLVPYTSTPFRAISSTDNSNFAYSVRQIQMSFRLKF